jgi:hypothetical protein
MSTVFTNLRHEADVLDVSSGPCQRCSKLLFHILNKETNTWPLVPKSLTPVCEKFLETNETKNLSNATSISGVEIEKTAKCPLVDLYLTALYEPSV